MRELVFTAAALHALPASRGYELWLIGPAGDRAVIMLPPARHGMTGPVVAAGLRPGDHLALDRRARPPAPPAQLGRPTTPMMLDVVLCQTLVPVRPSSRAFEPCPFVAEMMDEGGRR